MKSVAMIGFGGIARAHKNAHLRLEAEGKERLVAVCDIIPEAFKKNKDKYRYGRADCRV